MPFEKSFVKQDGRGADYGVFHFRILRPILFSEMVAQAGNATLARAVELIELGAVYRNNLRTINPSDLLESNDLVRIHSEPRRFRVEGKLLPRVVGTFGDPIDTMIVDKPAGLPTHAQVDNARENLLSLLELEITPRRLLITHRLDVETNGMLMLALTREAQARINSQLAEKKIIRRYHAWVEKPLVPETHRHFMKPSHEAPKTLSVEMLSGWKECRLKILACEAVDDFEKACGIYIEGIASARTEPETEPETKPSLSKDAALKIRPEVIWRLTIELETGRSQQIRAQLAALGSPILGDHAYGGKLRLKSLFTGSNAIALRAFEVTSVSN